MPADQLLTPEQADQAWDDMANSGPDDTSAPQASAVETPPADEPASEADDAAAQAAAAQPAQVDPLAALNEQIANLARTNADLVNNQKRLEGRMAAMQSEADTARAAAAKVGTSNAPTAAQVADASKSLEKWNAVKADFPEWSEAMEELVNHRTANIAPAAAPAPAGPSAADVADATALAIRKHELSYVESKHPGWVDTVRSPEFKAWAAKQDEAVRRLADSPFAADAVELLNRYKNPVKQQVDDLAARRANRLQASQSQRPGAKAQLTSTDGMTHDQLWDHEAAQLEARNR